MSSKFHKFSKWLLITTLVIIFLIGVRIPLYYEIEPISGYLYDEETGKPIEGAVVFADWWTIEGLYDHSQQKRAFSQHTQSDSAGYFKLPGWKFWWLPWFSTETMEKESPTVFFLKSGYVPHVEGVQIILNPPSGSNLKQGWIKTKVAGLDSHVFKLRPLPNDPTARYKIFHGDSFNRFQSYAWGCAGENRLVNTDFFLEIIKEQRLAINAGVHTTVSPEHYNLFLDSSISSEAACLLIDKGYLNEDY